VSGLYGDNSGVEVSGGDGVEKKAVWQGEDAVIIMGAGVVVRAAGQGIGAIGGAWLMEEVDIVVAQGQDVAGKAAIDLLGAMIILEIFMVSEDVDDEFGA
jgi:hypothetical protein